jgi:hypothetical protein
VQDTSNIWIYHFSFEGCFAACRRLENAENDCSLAGEGGGGGQHYGYGGGQTANGIGHQTANGGGGGGIQQAGYGGRQYSNPGNEAQFEFPSVRSDYDNTVSHPNAQVTQAFCTMAKRFLQPSGRRFTQIVRTFRDS